MRDDKHPAMFEREVKVYLSCSREWISAARIKVSNVEEDIQGRDLVTFECPECMEIHTSLCTR